MGLAGAIYDQWRVGNKKFFTKVLTLQYSAHKPTTHSKQHTKPKWATATLPSSGFALSLRE
jgi:hypothetical protein